MNDYRLNTLEKAQAFFYGVVGFILLVASFWVVLAFDGK